MTTVDIAQWIRQVIIETPECHNLYFSDDEWQSSIEGMVAEITALSTTPTYENTAKKIISLYLQLQGTKLQYDSLKHISVVVPRDLKETRVHIHDWDGNDCKYPRAIIMRRNPDFAESSYMPVEEIDIVLSVQKNTTAIRHFAVQIAIRRWTELVRYYSNFPVLASKTKVKKRIQAQGEPETETEYERGVRKRGFWYKIASEHLKRVGGQAILEQAEKDAIEPEIAFGLYIITP